MLVRMESLFSIDGSMNWCSHCGKQSGGFSKKLKIEPPYDPIISLLGMYLKKQKTLIWKNKCTPMPIIALFIISKVLKQTVFINRWMDRENVHTHTHDTMEHYLAIKKIKILPFVATWIYLEGIMLSEVSQTEKEKILYITYMWNLKNMTN